MRRGKEIEIKEGDRKDTYVVKGVRSRGKEIETKEGERKPTYVGRGGEER